MFNTRNLKSWSGLAAMSLMFLITVVLAGPAAAAQSDLTAQTDMTAEVEVGLSTGEAATELADPSTALACAENTAAFQGKTSQELVAGGSAHVIECAASFFACGATCTLAPELCAIVCDWAYQACVAGCAATNFGC